MTTNEAAERLRVEMEEGFSVAHRGPLLDEALAEEHRATVEALGLEGLRDHGYQPMYNGRPSCPFCLNFVDEEETHTPECALVAILDALATLDAEAAR